MHLNVLVERRRQSITMRIQPLGRKKKHCTYGPVCVAMRHKREEEIESVGMEGKDGRGEE